MKTVTLAGSALALPALVAPAMADKKSAAAPLIEKFAATLKRARPRGVRGAVLS